MPKAHAIKIAQEPQIMHVKSTKKDFPFTYVYPATKQAKDASQQSIQDMQEHYLKKNRNE